MPVGCDQTGCVMRMKASVALVKGCETVLESEVGMMGCQCERVEGERRTGWVGPKKRGFYT
jgi:hypothetical protein